MTPTVHEYSAARKLRVACCGAGISSLCLAYGLSKLANVQVRIYEASAQFRDDGAAFGLAFNAQTALQMIAPELRAALDDAGGVRMDPSARVMIGTGPDAGTHVSDIRHAIGAQIVVERGKLLRKIRAMLDVEQIMQMGKKLVLIEGNSEDAGAELTLGFGDGSTATADCVVGCDGVNSVVRSFIVDADHPSMHSGFTGGYGARKLISIEEAVRIFGHEYCADRTQMVWVGDGGALLTDFQNDGTSMQVISGWSNRGRTWPHREAWAKLPKEVMAADLEAWGPVGKAMTQVFCAADGEDLYVAASRSHETTPTYTKHRLCIAGDAAQTFPPARGAGAGQAVEDALALTRLLARVRSAEDIPAALQAYDAVRRPRRTMVAESSRDAAQIICGLKPGVGLDAQKLKHECDIWAEEIVSVDLAKECSAMLADMDRRLKR